MFSIWNALRRKWRWDFIKIDNLLKTFIYFLLAFQNYINFFFVGQPTWLTLKYSYHDHKILSTGLQLHKSGQTKTFKTCSASCYYVFVFIIFQNLLILWLNFLYHDLAEILIQKWFLDKQYEDCYEHCFTNNCHFIQFWIIPLIKICSKILKFISSSANWVQVAIELFNNFLVELLEWLSLVRDARETFMSFSKRSRIISKNFLTLWVSPIFLNMTSFERKTAPFWCS